MIDSILKYSLFPAKRLKDQTKVYELITEIEWTNQNARKAISEAENLIMLNNPQDEVEGIIRQYSLSLREIHIVLV